MPLAALLLWACGAQPGPGLLGDLRLSLAASDQDPYPAIVPLQPPAHTETPPLPPPPEPPPLPDPGGRVLYGAGYQMGFALDQVSHGGVGGGLFGLYLRLGYGLSDFWGFEAEITGATIVIWSYLREAITVDFTPVDWFTVALGPVSRQDVDLPLCSNGGGEAATTETESLGGAARFEFHMDANRTSTGRSGTSLGLEADLGTAVGAASVGAKGPAFGVYLLAGFMHY